jgi:hypothetical protein
VKTIAAKRSCIFIVSHDDDDDDDVLFVCIEMRVMFLSIVVVFCDEVVFCMVLFVDADDAVGYFDCCFTFNSK